MDSSTNISNDICRLLARTARAKALEIEVPMVIAFADARGEMVHFQRMAKALPVSTEIAMNKAYTAAALRMPTHEAGPLTQPGQPLYGLELTNQGKMVVFGGGFPLKMNGSVVGAIGVSGGSVDQDMTVAGAAVTAFEEMMETARTLSPLLPDALKNTASGSREALARKLETMAPSAGINPGVLEGAFYLIPTR